MWIFIILAAFVILGMFFLAWLCDRLMEHRNHEKSIYQNAWHDRKYRDK